MVRLPAPAKINLTLEVLARHSDGYHGVRSVMVPLELADELTIEPSTRFTFACDQSDLDDERNLAYAAARLLGDAPPVRLQLRKRIPMQAGLGGGSSDAAAVLRAAMAGEFGPMHHDWLRLARALGSDVPFFLAGTAALVEGTGERVTPLGAIPHWHVLIVKPPVAVLTAAAYAQLDSVERPLRPRNRSASIALLEALQRDDFERVESLMQNDFHDLLLSRTPEIKDAVAALRAAGATKVLLAGSGSCVFTLAMDQATIQRLAEGLDLPANYKRLITAFATTPQWR